MELDGAWAIFASPLMTLVCAAAMVVVLVRLGFHRDKKGALTRRRLASVVGLSASVYTFGLCIFSQLIINGPEMSELISSGFGNERVAWLLVVVVGDGVFRLWDEYRPSPT